MVFVVMAESLVNGGCKVSQEGYKTLKEAQDFCLSRGTQVKKLNNYKFRDGHWNLYTIYEVSIKD